MASSIIEDTILCKFFTHRLVKWSCQFEIDELMFTYDIRVLCLFLNQVITNIHLISYTFVNVDIYTMYIKDRIDINQKP